jgi:phosphatidylglycerophosphate synthase
MSNDFLPLLILAVPFGFFLLRLLQFYVLWILGRRVPTDQEMLRRGQSFLLGQSLRQAFVWAMAPYYRVLERARIHPNTLTVSCLVFSVVAGVTIAFGDLLLGGVLGIMGSSLDFLDGRLARNTGQSSKAGAFLDSTLDRYCDIAFLSGAALFFRDSVPVLTACLLGMGSAIVISYTRAKAEALGAELKVGLMQRPERVVLFCLGAIVSPLVEPLLPPDLQGRQIFFASILVVMAVLTTLTSVQRTVVGFRNVAQLTRTDGKDD